MKDEAASSGEMPRLAHAADEVVVGTASTDSLIDAAVYALGYEADSQSLRLLAGLTGWDRSDAEELFLRALSELGIPVPNLRDAVMRLAVRVAGDIAGGHVPPYEGARHIWWLALETEDKLVELDPFIYAASEWEDRPEDRPFFDEAIVSEARDLWTRHLSGAGPA